MTLKEARYKACKSCGSTKCVAPEKLGCDTCKRPKKKNECFLSITIFFKADEGETDTHDMDFCSWACLFKTLPDVETNYFISLPYLSYDNDTPGQTAEDFFKALRLRRPRRREKG